VKKWIAALCVVLAGIVGVYGVLSYYCAIGDGINVAFAWQNFSLASMDEGEIVGQWLTLKPPHVPYRHPAVYRDAKGYVSKDCRFGANVYYGPDMVIRSAAVPHWFVCGLLLVYPATRWSLGAWRRRHPKRGFPLAA